MLKTRIIGHFNLYFLIFQDSKAHDKMKKQKKFKLVKESFFFNLTINFRNLNHGIIVTDSLR